VECVQGKNGRGCGIYVCKQPFLPFIDWNATMGKYYPVHQIIKLLTNPLPSTLPANNDQCQAFLPRRTCPRFSRDVQIINSSANKLLTRDIVDISLLVQYLPPFFGNGCRCDRGTRSLVATRATRPAVGVVASFWFRGLDRKDLSARLGRLQFTVSCKSYFSL
jgi:hypothetical protein